MQNELTARPLSHAEFAPFGDVIETVGAEIKLINAGTTERFHALAESDPGPNGSSIISIFRGQPRQFPFTLAMMERHPLGSQAFYPLADRSWLVAVAEDQDGEPGEPHLFLATGTQGVNYRANVWHHPLLALDEISDFLVVDRSGPGENLEEWTYAQPYRIEHPGQS